MDTSPAPFGLQAERLSFLIADALADTAEGLPPDLDALTRETETLCKMAPALPVSERPAAQEQITAIVDRLDQLAAVLNAHKEALQREMAGVTHSQQAARAYIKAKKE